MEEDSPQNSEFVVSPKRSHSSSDLEKLPLNKKQRLGFSFEKFRKEIKTNTKNIVLQEFFQVIDDDLENITKYLQKGGSPLEILQSLDGETGASPVLVFDVVNKILLQIGAKLPKFQTAAYDSCKFLLNNYISLINKMLNLSSTMKERVAVLKLLTTIVTFSAVLAKDILLSVNFNPTNLEMLTKIRAGNEARGSFIHLITAFLVHGHFPTLSVLLEKKGFMTSIVNGLQYDSAEIVILVLTAMKNHILENPLVSKTLKMKTFSTKVIKDIVNLYNWKGPGGLDRSKSERTVEESDKTQVNEAVHSFLLVLCTSHKFGVIFKDPFVGLNQRANGLILTILESLERPWEHSYAGELVIKICKSCPDLVKNTWINLKVYLEPRWTTNWLKTIDFTDQLLDEIQPENIEFALNNLSDSQIFQVVVSLTSPIFILKVLNLEIYDQPSTRHKVISIFLKMITTIEVFLNCARLWQNFDHSKFSANLANHICQNFPSIQALLTNWNSTDENLKVTDYSNLVFDLLEKYQLLAPKILDDFNLDFNISEFLLELELISEKKLLVKVANFFINFEASLFTSKTELFKKSLEFSLEYYHDSKDITAFKFLQKLLKNLGVFDGWFSEIDFWINAVLNLKHFDCNILTFLLDLIKKCEDNSVEFHKKLFGNNANFSSMILAVQDFNLSKSHKRYLSFVILNIFHSQYDTSFFIESLQDVDLPESLMEYMQSWCNSKPINLKKSKGNLMEQFEEFSKKFLETELDTFNLNLYSNQKLDFLQTTIFYLTNLSKINNLQSNHKTNCTKFIECLFNEKVFEDSRYIKIIFGNLSLLESFTIFNPDDFSTRFLIDLIKKLDGSIIDVYLYELRLKIFTSLNKVLRKGDQNTSISIEPLEIIALDSEQCKKLLIKFINNSDNKYFYEVATYCLNRLSSLKLKPLDSTIVQELSIIFNVLIKDNYPNSNLLSKSFYNYFQVFPNSLQDLDLEIFESLLTLTEFNKDNLLFCEFLLDRIPKCRDLFEKNLEEISSKRSFILTLLDVVVKHYNNNNIILEKIFKKLEPHILKAIQKPHKAGQHFQNHFKSVGFLIQKFMKIENFTKQIQKFETTELFHVYFLKIIYDKTEKTEKNVSNVILTFIHLLMNLLKQKKLENLNEIGEIVFMFLQNNNQNLPGLVNNETVKNFTKFCLKFGILGDDILLKILTQLIEICINENDGKLILEMMFSHSQFLDIILGDSKREEIFNLWLKLCEKYPKFMERNHIPVLLASYRATNSEKNILNLLKLYEANHTQTKFYDFKPFLWGRAAASHYSIRSDLQVLWRQPKMVDVLNNLHLDTIRATILNPEDKSSYDLDFFLPLFSHMLSPENPITTYKFTRSGALALALTGFRGCKLQRLATCNILQRFYFHLESKQSGKDILLWLRFIEAICKGIAVIEDFKINNFVGLFLSRTALILTQPIETMYVPLSQYLAAKDNLDFSTIPELYTFLHSSHVDSKKHKLFILKILRDGLKTDHDFLIFLKSMGFKLISSLISSNLCDLQIKFIILEIFEKIVNLGFKILNGNLSFLSLISSLILQNYQDGKVLFQLFKILFKIIEIDDNRQRNFLIYFNLIYLFTNHYQFLKESKSLEVFFEILMIITNRFPDFLTSANLNLILGKTNDGFCQYLVEYGCQFVRIEDFFNENKNLRLLVYNKLKLVN